MGHTGADPNIKSQLYYPLPTEMGIRIDLYVKSSKIRVEVQKNPLTIIQFRQQVDRWRTYYTVQA